MQTRRDQMKHIGRLLKRADFLRVQSAGKKWVTPTCIVQVATHFPSPSQGEGQPHETLSPPVSPPNKGGGTPGPFTYRYGITVTKKIWPRAVDRNRVRRRVRAVVLGLLANLPDSKNGQALDFVVLPRDAALTAPIATIEKDLKWALKRLLGGENPP